MTPPVAIDDLATAVRAAAALLAGLEPVRLPEAAVAEPAVVPVAEPSVVPAEPVDLPAIYRELASLAADRIAPPPEAIAS